MKYRLVLLLGLVAFAVTLAVVVGQRLSSESMAVIVGVVAGVAASIPTSLIIVWVATRTSQAVRPGPVEMPTPTPQPPRVVVVQPQPAAGPPLSAPAYGYSYGQPAPNAAYSMAYPPPFAPPQPQQRTFTVIGEEALEGIQPMWADDNAGHYAAFGG